MTRADIEAVLVLVPDLTDQGVGISNLHGRMKPAEYAARMAEERARLLNSGEACAKVVKWLETVERIKTVNDRHSSYGLKHIMQAETGEYVTNGAFIAAAIHAGFTYRLGGLNASFGIAERSLKGRPTI